MKHLTLLFGLAVAASVVACGDDDGKKKPFSGTGATGGASTGGAPGGGGASGDGGASGSGGASGGGGASGSGGASGGGGSGGGGTGGSGGGGTGGSGGGPTGPEICTDGFDNDGDGDTDCADSECAAACASACAKPTVLADPTATQGTTVNHPDSQKNSCSGTPSGPDLAYEFTATKTGVFEAILGGFTPLTLSVRSGSCAGTELGCSAGKSLKLPVTAGTKLWLVVDGASGASGAFGLTAESRPIDCGDGHRDGTEACDDGNKSSGDGCSASCTVEAKGSEPNDTAAQANTWASPWVASIGTASDQDVVKVVLTKTGSISASVQDFGDQACELDMVDSYIELWASDDTLLAIDNDSGEGKCSSVSKSGLAAGTYYVMVKAAPGANPATFAYKLSVTLN